MQGSHTQDSSGQAKTDHGAAAELESLQKQSAQEMRRRLQFTHCVSSSLMTFALQYQKMSIKYMTIVIYIHGRSCIT